MPVSIVVLLEAVNVDHHEGEWRHVTLAPPNLPDQILAELTEVVERGQLVPVDRRLGLLEQLQLDNLWIAQAPVDLDEVADQCGAKVDLLAETAPHTTAVFEDRLPVASRLDRREAEVGEQVNQIGIDGVAVNLLELLEPRAVRLSRQRPTQDIRLKSPFP